MDSVLATSKGECQRGPAVSAARTQGRCGLVDNIIPRASIAAPKAKCSQLSAVFTGTKFAVEALSITMP